MRFCCRLSSEKIHDYMELWLLSFSSSSSIISHAYAKICHIYIQLVIHIIFFIKGIFFFHSPDPV